MSYPSEWTCAAGDVWTRTMRVRDGEPLLLLRVLAAALPGFSEAWQWEVVEAEDCDGVDGQIDTGMAPSPEAAAAAAVAKAHVQLLGDA